MTSSATRSVRTIALLLMLATTLALSGCKTAKEKAEDYYQSGLALLAAGDEDRAMVEFRNVFKYDGFHKEARKTYADILVKEGKLQEAYSQYLRLIEQYPDTPAVRLTLAELAIDRGDWAEVERHGRAAIALTPEDPRAQAIKLALDYRAAVLADDMAARDKIAGEARSFLQTHPDSQVASRVLIDRLVAGPDPLQALPVIDQALKSAPDMLEFHMLKFRLLAQAEDIKGTGAQLKVMFDRFPENDTVKTALIGWYMVQKDYDGAEAFLRKLAADPTGASDAHLALVQFLQLARGTDAARAELDGLVEANQGTANAALYGAMLATINFQSDQQEAAIAVLQDIVKAAEPSDQTRRIKGILAQMLDETGNRVGARALVEEVLAEDPSNVDALKLRAAWLITEDKPGDAIVDLRTALDQSPRDPSILTLMASAHERDGSLDLAGEQLARAVEVSGGAAEESVRYAQFLIQHQQSPVAETVLVNARRVSPGNPAILGALAQYYIRLARWSEAQEAVDALKVLNLPDDRTGLQQLQAAIFSGQNRFDDSLALLKAQVAKGSQSDAAVVMIVQTQVQADKLPEARAYLDGALQAAPDNATLKLLGASLDQQMGKPDAAAATYRAQIARDPANDVPVRLLYALLRATGKADEATKVLDAGLLSAPKSADLRWIKAGELEASGQIEPAIAVYDALYAEDSSNIVVANNLASLITSYHDDAASLARAEAIARRLRGLDVPAFQDTYGWIAFRLNNLDDALTHLEPAAEGLPKDLLTQFHLGMVYDKLGRRADAIRQFELVLSLAAATPGSAALPQIKTARQSLARLQAQL